MTVTPTVPSPFEPSLPLVEVKTEDPDKTEVVQFVLKARRGSPATAPTYKVALQRFYDGTPSKLILLLKGMEEVWTQNSLDDANDRLATVRALLRGESLTTFEGSIDEALPDIDIDDLEVGLDAVKQVVFPFCALEFQKTYMRRRMRKPELMTFHKMTAAVT